MKRVSRRPVFRRALSGSALVFKVALSAYALAAPWLWRNAEVDIDLTAVYAVAAVFGGLMVTIDVPLSLLFLMALGITMASVKRKVRDAPATTGAATATQQQRAPPQRAAARAFGLAPSAPAAVPAPTPTVPAPPETFRTETPRTETPRKETFEALQETRAAELDAPESGAGPRYLLRPDGAFVTDDSLKNAQSNAVGEDDVYSPLGPDSYSVQGRGAKVPVVPMEW